MDLSINNSDMSRLSSNSPNSSISILSRTIKKSRKVFMGTYLERRYVRCLQAYRDIIVVEKDEQELMQCLDEVRKVAEQQYGTDKWLGLTCNFGFCMNADSKRKQTAILLLLICTLDDTKDSVIQKYSLWVELEKIPLGKHWFQLRSIKVEGHGIQLQLKYLRTIQTTERNSLDVIEYPSINYRELFTYENLSSSFKFSAVLVMSVLTILCNALWYLGDYSIKMTHELSGLIHALTPFAFSVMDFFSKCVAGLYWLLYVLWRGNSMPTYRVPPPEQPKNQQILRNDDLNRRAIY